MKMFRDLDNLVFFMLTYHFGELHSAILSRNKAVQSSSIAGNWIPSRAVDGNNDTNAERPCECCFATIIELNPWYELDLGKSHKIHRIDVLGRHYWNRHGQSFQNMEILFSQVCVNGFTVSPEIKISRPVGEVQYVLPEPKYTRYISLVLRNVIGNFTMCVLTVYGECEDREYGDYCENRCHCDGDPCDKVTGICPSGKCLPGYYGEKCDTGCDDGTYGENCVRQCGRCYNDTVCDNMSGRCARCAAGFKGDNCDVEDLPCGAATTSGTLIVVAIGGTAGTILLIEAFVGVVVYLIWKRRHGQSDRRSPEEINPYEMPDREAFTSEHPYESKQRNVTTNQTYENTQRPQNNE